MARILSVKDSAVTVGVLDKDVHVEPDLIEVTYADHNGTPHTVFAHRNGPFETPDEIVQAHIDGTLHTEAEPVAQSDESPPPAGPVFD